MDSVDPTYSKSQLALRNGHDKPEIWVAFRGWIYDVCESRLWKNGKHYEHWAGQDLTHELKDAPHAEWVFKKFKIIGRLQHMETNNWIEKQNALEKTFIFKDFETAISFMVKASFTIEKLNHHPEWTNVYNRLFVKLTTHDAGNTITDKDRQLADALDKLYLDFIPN